MAAVEQDVVPPYCVVHVWADTKGANVNAPATNMADARRFILICFEFIRDRLTMSKDSTSLVASCQVLWDIDKAVSLLRYLLDCDNSGLFSNGG